MVGGPFHFSETENGKVARYYEDPEDEQFDFGSLPEIQQQHFLYDLIGFTGMPGDSEVHDMFWQLMYNNELSLDERMAVYENLSDYLQDEYDLIFEEIWDWEDFRDWYAAA